MYCSLLRLGVCTLCAAIIQIGVACQVADCPGREPCLAHGQPESIIGGEQTGFEHWQGVVALRGDSGEFCSGALVHPQVAVTAGHCVLYPDAGVELVLHPEQAHVYAGTSVLDDTDAAYVSAVEDIEVHFSWNGELDDPEQHDVAAVLLVDPASGLEQYPVRVAPAPEVGEPGIIVGYGSAGDDGVGIHREGAVEVTSVDDRLIGLGGGAGACPGDFGGPLFVEQGPLWALSGVISSANCEQPATTTAVNLVAVRDWLDLVMVQWTGEELPKPDGGLPGDAGDKDAGADAGDGSPYSFTAHGEACSCGMIGRADPPRHVMAIVLQTLLRR